MHNRNSYDIKKWSFEPCSRWVGLAAVMAASALDPAGQSARAHADSPPAAQGRPVASPSASSGDSVPPVSEALRTARRHLYDPAISVLTTRTVPLFFETAPVRAGGQTWRLPRAPRPLTFQYTFEGTERDGAAFVKESYTNGLLILKNGAIVYEYYGNMANDRSLFQSSSMSKSVASLLVGIAIHDGYLKSVDDAITLYVPSLEQTAYQGVSVRNLLEMRSGVTWDDSFAHDGPAKRIQEMALFDNVARFTDAAAWVQRGNSPGSTYNYNSLDSALLGLVLRKATRQTLADFMSARMWRPAGMEADAAWMLDGPIGIGQEFTGGGFNATLRDWGRIGLLMLQEGHAQGRQIVPAEWVRASTDTAQPIAHRPFDYGYQWFRLRGTRVTLAKGGGGQYIYIDPEHHAVIVKMSSVPRDAEQRRYGHTSDAVVPLDDETLAFMSAAAAGQP